MIALLGFGLNKFGEEKGCGCLLCGFRVFRNELGGVLLGLVEDGI